MNPVTWRPLIDLPLFHAMKIAILDDYLNVSQKSADWSMLRRQHEITVFDRALTVPDEAARVLAPFDIICLMRERMPFPEPLIQRLPQLKMIAITGYYNRTLDVAAALKRNVVVSYTEFRGPSRNSTCEITWGLILAAARHIPQEHINMRAGGWQTTIGITLADRTLGLLGLGKQGRLMVPIARAFGMKVIAWSRNLTREACEALGVTHVSKDELFRLSDVLSVHLVLGERSRNLVGTPELALMKPTALLINVARGPIINQDALIAALRENRIAGAGLDVYDEEPLPSTSVLRTLPNVVLTPHLGYSVEEFYQVAYAQVVENIAAYLRGQPIRLLVPEKNASDVNP